jgi:threonine/homoserine/homoserine lactone efflux protein
MSTYLAFVATATGAVLMPGPDMLVVLRTALTAGARAGAWAAAGSAAGNLLWGAATVLGATALLTMSATAFSALKLAGAAYLAWLGFQALRAARRGELLAAEGETGKPPGAGKAFRRGLASDLANVKVGLFWTALVPQFMSDAGGVLLGAMVVTMAGLAFVALAGFALAAGRMRAALGRPHVSRAVNGTVGLLLVGLAAKLAGAAR